jgi:hypothetical protein
VTAAHRTPAGAVQSFSYSRFVRDRQVHSGLLP